MRRVLTVVAVTALVGLFAAPPAPVAADGAVPGSRVTLMRYAEHTWASFTAMVDTSSGLPTDQLYDDGHTDVQTSTTNVGAYLWSAVAAERLGIIGHHELGTPADDDCRHPRADGAAPPDGQFYNWYDHRDGTKLTTWPPTGAPLDPILSSVDNAWLATGLHDRARGRARAGRAGRCAVRLDGLRLLLRAGEEPDPVPLLAGARQRAVLLRHGRLARAGSSTTSASRRATCRARSTTAAGAPSPTRATSPSGAETDRLLDPLRRRRRLRGSYAYGRTRITPSWGGIDVRGADAGAVRARGGVGRRGAPGGRTIRSPSTPRSTTG